MRTAMAGGSNEKGARLVLLGYHKVGPPPAKGWENWFHRARGKFERDLQWLQQSGWQVISASRFVAGLSSPALLPARSVLLTFDDGYQSMRKIVLPLLQPRGFPAALFVPTDFIGRMNSFDAGIEPEEVMCDWDDLLDLQSHGVSIQSHGVSHRRFSELDDAERDRELSHSKALLEDRLGGSVELFSYPYGDYGGDRPVSAATMRRAGYKASCLYGGGIHLLPIPDAYQVQRVPMGADTDLAEVIERG